LRTGEAGAAVARRLTCATVAGLAHSLLTVPRLAAAVALANRAQGSLADPVYAGAGPAPTVDVAGISVITDAKSSDTELRKAKTALAAAVCARRDDTSARSSTKCRHTVVAHRAWSPGIGRRAGRADAFEGHAVGWRGAGRPRMSRLTLSTDAGPRQAVVVDDARTTRPRQADAIVTTAVRATIGIGAAEASIFATAGDRRVAVQVTADRRRLGGRLCNAEVRGVGSSASRAGRDAVSMVGDD